MNPNADRFREARLQMIEQQIAARGIRDPDVLRALAETPREQFVLPRDAEIAYDDRALAIDCDQTISQPYIVAYMSEKLRIDPTHQVLEIGTGSGYQTAILARLTRHLHTIERLDSLSRHAARRLADLGITGVHFHVADGSLGCPQAAPFDRIIVTAAAPSVPTPLMDQLVDGGRMLIPIGDATQQTILSIIKRGPRIVEVPLIPCRFVKLLGQSGW